MADLQKTLSWGVRLRRSLGMSFCAALFAGIAGVLAFWMLAMVLAPKGADEAGVDQDFFLVIVNIPLVSVALGLLSFFAQLASKRVAVDLAMLCFAIVLFVGLLSMYHNYADAGSSSDKMYLVGALIPGLVMTVAHWAFFKIMGAHRYDGLMRGVV
ncbi:hypothetical protein [Ciceribacter selenitireducens]